MKNKILIFDFDGTIADTFEFVPQIVDELAEEFKFEKLSRSDIERLREKSAREVMRELKISGWKAVRMLLRARVLLQKDLKKVKVFDGLNVLFNELKKDYTLVIASSNSVENITDILKANNIDAFDTILSKKSLFKKSRPIRKFLKKSKFDTKNAIYIGDEVRDFETAEELGMKSILVSWGYNSLERLQATKAPVATSVKELKRLILELTTKDFADFELK